jgi:hypothetical protein
MTPKSHKNALSRLFIYSVVIKTFFARTPPFFP